MERAGGNDAWVVLKVAEEPGFADRPGGHRCGQEVGQAPAAPKSDYTAYMYLGELIEFDITDKIFINPGKKETEDYITGRFGLIGR